MNHLNLIYKLNNFKVFSFLFLFHFLLFLNKTREIKLTKYTNALKDHDNIPKNIVN